MNTNEKRIIKQRFKFWNIQHKNIITPNILRIIVLNNNKLIEISKGNGINHNIIYGVTLFDFDENTFKVNSDLDLNKCCNSLEEVKTRIKEIKEVLKK